MDKQTLWNKASFLKNIRSEKRFVKSLHDFCEEKILDKQIIIKYGKGKTHPTFNLFFKALGAHGRVVLGVYSKGTVWTLFDEKVLTKKIANELRERLSHRIPGLDRDLYHQKGKKKGKPKEWAQFEIENENQGTLEALKNTISWLARIDWKNKQS